MGAFFKTISDYLAKPAQYVGAHLLQWIMRFMMVVMILALIYPILPDDPFRGSIQQWASVCQRYSAWINALLPVKFIMSSALFSCALKYFLWLYRKVYSVFMETDGEDLTDVE